MKYALSGREITPSRVAPQDYSCPGRRPGQVFLFPKNNSGGQTVCYFQNDGAKTDDEKITKKTIFDNS